jgi:hypothetical protein
MGSSVNVQSAGSSYLQPVPAENSENVFEFNSNDYHGPADELDDFVVSHFFGNTIDLHLNTVDYTSGSMGPAGEAE